MAWDTFIKIVYQIQDFDLPLKAIHFQGMGEPLINKDLPKMIAYCKEKGVAERLNLITNGALLTEELSLSLIDAGIDNIKISLQGITAQKYYETCGIPWMNFDKLVNNIRFLYEHKKNCEVFVKIADISMGEGDVKRFYVKFGEISDRANIEYIKNMFQGVNPDFNKNLRSNMYAQPHQKYEVCSLGFFMMYINSNGDVYPCCNHIDPAGWGNIYQHTLKEIWNGEQREAFLDMMLSHERNQQDEYPICNGCNIPDAVLRAEDSLDEF
jgi:cyclic pyranopterin phosphate synthase